MKKISEVSVYYLILELLDGGETGLLPDLEPIPADVLIAELGLRTGLNLGNNERAWAKWFMGDTEFGSELERANLFISLQTQDTMTRIWKRVNNRKP